MSDQMVILTVRMLDDDDKLTTVTTSAIPQSSLDAGINSFVRSGAKRGQTVEGVECKLAFDPTTDQQEFAEAWNAIKDDRSIPYSLKFKTLALTYRTTTTKLYETQRLSEVLRRRTYEIKQKIIGNQ
jgi:hypothetical protein